MDIHVFMDISIHFYMLLRISIWISLPFYGYPCVDLLWILDPGLQRLASSGVGIVGTAHHFSIFR